MSIRQYIGARYVPKIFDNAGSSDWVSGIAYEALTVVTYLNNSYTSKKAVPSNIGNPAANPDYWVNTGDYSGLATRVNNLQNTVDGMITKKTALYIGNSFVNGTGAFPEEGLFYQTKNLFDDAYESIWDGAGFVAYTGHTVTYADLLSNAASNPLIDNDAITDIIFVPAVGDWRAYTEDNANYDTSLASSLTSIRSTLASFPNAKNVLCILADARQEAVRTELGMTITNESSYYLHHLYKSVMGEYGITYMGWIGWEIFQDSTCYQADKLHPNLKGCTLLGTYFRQAYYGSYVPSVYKSSFNTQYENMAKLRFQTNIVFSPDMMEVFFDAYNSSYMPASYTMSLTSEDNGALSTALRWPKMKDYPTYQVLIKVGPDADAPTIMISYQLKVVSNALHIVTKLNTTMQGDKTSDKIGTIGTIPTSFIEIQ